MNELIIDYSLPKRDVVRWRQPFIWPYLIGFIGCLLFLSASGLLMGYLIRQSIGCFGLGWGLRP